VELSAEERNEEIYQSLISLIENSQGRLAPIIAACDDSEVRDRTILHYEADAQQLNIKTYRIVLSNEPSIRAELAKLKEAEPYLQQGSAAVFTVTGVDLLSRVKSSDIDDEQTEIDKFFGYLQWTREGFQEFPYPIVIWVSYQILREMSRRAPDFWSWRKKVLRFENTSEGTIQFGGLSPSEEDEDNEDEFLPPLTELQAQIHKLVTISPNSASLGTLYSKLGQVYARQIERGESEDLEQDRQATIKAYEMAIDLHKTLHFTVAWAETLWKIGDLFNQWQLPKAHDYYQQSFTVRRINKIESELDNLKITRDLNGEAKALKDLGECYASVAEYQQAIDYYQQSLLIYQEVGNNLNAADSSASIYNNQNIAHLLARIGNIYKVLEHYQQAINYYQQALDVYQNNGDRQNTIFLIVTMLFVFEQMGNYQQQISYNNIDISIQDLRGKLSEKYKPELSMFSQLLESMKITNSEI
jgi:tetratricopeptide (TPR) repeat protein